VIYEDWVKFILHTAQSAVKSALSPFSEDQQRWLEAHGMVTGYFSLTVISVAWDRVRTL